jgi:hypothetical protein
MMALGFSGINGFGLMIESLALIALGVDFVGMTT